jgi:hypothetical protein
LETTESDNFMRCSEIRCDTCGIGISEEYKHETVQRWNSRTKGKPGDAPSADGTKALYAPSLNTSSLPQSSSTSRIEALEASLSSLLERYTGLVNSGDAGNWDPEKEPCVIAARAALDQGSAT